MAVHRKAATRVPETEPEPGLAALAAAIFMASAVEILTAIRSIILKAAIWMTS